VTLCAPDVINLVDIIILRVCSAIPGKITTKGEKQNIYLEKDENLKLPAKQATTYIQIK
jgi:hypothetical protein